MAKLMAVNHVFMSSSYALILGILGQLLNFSASVFFSCKHGNNDTVCLSCRTLGKEKVTCSTKIERLRILLFKKYK